MASVLWYIGLAAVSATIGIFAIYKKRRVYKISTLIVFWLFTASVTWIGEFIVLGIFDSYAYKPGISSDPWVENLVGHLFLNASMFPAAAILFVTYSLHFGGASIITAYFVLSEYLFTRLGLYEHHWWSYYMSVINTTVFMLLSRKWFYKVKHAKYNIPRLVTLYFVGFLLLHTPSPFLLLLMKQYYSLDLINNLVGNLYRSSIIFIFSYQLIESLFLVFFICILGKWYWKLVPFAIVAAGQSIMAKTNILVFQEGWKLSYTLFLYFIQLGLFILTEKYTLKHDGYYASKK